ncbi:antibiotic biosynthesis monooxygenase family protein [Roseibium polysiphoniae]|uniref:Antibiotic biosynthesis monooxygenase n=1 Tax=Roseibium polysiphoniae TaxID=2571221 RepID=A0ABR9C4I3_9HYPH|nr:antibiotic biosynthesis monooxygenase [Roseibium polysiphoniae]MBD8874754.1 antibiotic biosynthesis monooxygenase [Roseibium polysiphoniae]
MIAVIFEVYPHEEHKARYLDIAANLRPVLEEIDGFISVERFESLTTPGKLLSFSVFRDEKALDDWRNVMAHRKAQTAGRNFLFKDYRLRVTGVIRDYGMTERDEAPSDSCAVL